MATEASLKNANTDNHSSEDRNNAHQESDSQPQEVPVKCQEDDSMERVEWDSGSVHRCSICDRTYTTLRQLQKHSYRHVTTKSHLCSQCGKSYSCSSELRAHSRSHSGEKPFSCQVNTICDLQFYKTFKY